MKDADFYPYYTILGIEQRCNDDAQIKTAWKQRALELHPDKNQAMDASEIFQKLEDAYNALKDSESRTV